jgi:hypothetical protein
MTQEAISITVHRKGGQLFVTPGSTLLEAGPGSGHQERAGWGAKVIDRLSHDLRQAFPDMGGFSSEKPPVHAHVRRRVVGAVNHASAACAIDLAPSRSPFPDHGAAASPAPRSGITMRAGRGIVDRCPRR